MRRNTFSLSAGWAAVFLLLLVIAPAAWAGQPAVRAATIAVEKAAEHAAPASVQAPAGLRPRLRAVHGEPRTIDAGLNFNLLGATGTLDPASGLAVADDGAGAALSVRSSVDGRTWSEWFVLPMTSAAGDVGPSKLMAEPCWVGSGRYVQYVVAGPARDVQLVFINSAGDATLADRLQGRFAGAAASLAAIFEAPPAAAMTSTPTIHKRSEWRANESIVRDKPEYAPTVKVIFVHHTVSGNGYAKSSVPSIIKGIQYYHVKSVGFDDIGYNFLIDRFGGIWEGRAGGITKAVIGAQTLGFNTGSAGVSFIGNYSSVAPSSASLTALKKLLAWELDIHHTNPTASQKLLCRASEKFKAGTSVSFNPISGHRQACYTTCPGGSLYAKLPGVRSAVAVMGLPKIYTPAVSNKVITPNGDGVNESTRLSFSASGTVSWTIRIINTQQATVRAWAGSGSSGSLTWGGTDANGVVVPDGAYTVRFEAKSGGRSARSANFGIVVDGRPPTITNASIAPSELPRGNGSLRPAARASYTVSENVAQRVTIRNASGSAVRVVSNWTWVKPGTRAVSWDGNIVFSGARIVAPDGAYTMLIQVKDRAGNVAATRLPLTCVSDPAHWRPAGATFATKALQSFSIRRGSRATFRYMVVLAPPFGQPMPFTKASFTLRLRDANGNLRLTRRRFDVPVNAARSYSISPCNLARGKYRYYVYASLSDGTPQQLVGSQPFTIK